jgi:prepilin-type N-terminal cleavage/methylation domain-containing protein
MRASQRGMTLPELMVAMVIMAIIGAALVKLLVVQNRFFDHQTSLRSARSVSRGAVNMILSDLRMVDASGGVGDTLGIVAAAARNITVRVPYAMGVVCNVGASVTVTMVPLDTLMLNTAAFSGYAWRDTVNGKYHFIESGATVTTSTPANCAAGFTTLTGARVVSLSPLPVAGTVGTVSLGQPVMLHQQIRYELKASVTYPGQYGLWRTLLKTSLAEEVAAPFDTSAVFKFYVNNVDTSQAAVPAQLSTIRGLEFVFNAMSERTAQGRSKRQQVRTTTAVFFKNRLN